MTAKRNLAANLRAIMKQQKLTQMGLKSKSGVAQATIGRILREESAADIDTLDALAKACSMDSWQLLLPKLDPSHPPVVTLSPEERALYERLRSAAALIVQKNQ